MSSSPYKKMKSTNRNYCGYVSAKTLVPHHLYKIVKMVHTSHEKHGEGELMTLHDAKNNKYLVQFPTKYLRQFDEEQIKTLYNDISKMDYPFFVFREVVGTSFRCDLIGNDKEMTVLYQKAKDLFKTNSPMEELDTSIDESRNED